MRKIDWISKLTSRKFWTAVATFISMLIVALGGAEQTATQVTAIIMAGAAVVAYIIGEGLVDAARAADSEAAQTVWNSGYLVTEPEAKPPEGEQTTMDFDPDGDDGK